MSTLHQYVAVIGCFQGLLLFILLVTDARVSSASRVLGLFCLILGLTFLLPFITNGLADEAFHGLAGWLFFFPASYGPLLYLYCRNALLDKPLQRLDLIHAIPQVSCYLLNLDTLLFDNESIRLWVVGASAPTWRLWFSEYLLFAIAVIYALATVIIIRRYQRQAGHTLSGYNPDIFKWLWTLVISAVMIWSAKAIMSFSNTETPTMIVLSDVLIVVLIYLIALAQWRNARLFTIEHLTEADRSGEIVLDRSRPASDGVLDDETRRTLFESVRQQVEDQCLYRHSDLTLAGLAEATGLGLHHLSEVLNQHAGKNFNQFINAYRIDDVCKRLRAGDTEKILDIALAAGFSSKSTFNTIFKKFTGVTPSQYRQNLTHA